MPPHLEAALEPIAQHLLEARMHGSLEGALLGAGLLPPAPVEEPFVRPPPSASSALSAHP
ncbi:hypothetical protein [Corallococcus exercitus]|uniref:Uncharacterized protein n=1 Tax=Corallococcus exercitus TaxID=2316736 RepID=A0A7Y4JN11_9BACT|nr:hypothetical protein [Corallococcus exercitus]NOK08010.1 hypothetical protein [Corallococcus exercitus]